MHSILAATTPPGQVRLPPPRPPTAHTCRHTRLLAFVLLWAHVAVECACPTPPSRRACPADQLGAAHERQRQHHLVRLPGAFSRPSRDAEPALAPPWRLGRTLPAASPRCSRFASSGAAALWPDGGAATAHGGRAAAFCCSAQEFVSGDGFGLPSPVPDMVVRGKTLPEAAAKWKDILFTTGAKAGDYLTGARWSGGAGATCWCAADVPRGTGQTRASGQATGQPQAWSREACAGEHPCQEARTVERAHSRSGACPRSASLPRARSRSHHHGLLRLRLPRAPHRQGNVPALQRQRQRPRGARAVPGAAPHRQGDCAGAHSLRVGVSQARRSAQGRRVARAPARVARARSAQQRCPPRLARPATPAAAPLPFVAARGGALAHRWLRPCPPPWCSLRPGPGTPALSAGGARGPQARQRAPQGQPRGRARLQRPGALGPEVCPVCCCGRCRPMRAWAPPASLPVLRRWCGRAVTACRR